MSILNFVFEEKHTPKKPVGTKVTHSSGKTYIKESTGWYNSVTGNKLDYKSSLILEAAKDYVVKQNDGIYIDGTKLSPEQASHFKNAFYKNGEWHRTNGGGKISGSDESKLNDAFYTIQNEIHRKKSEEKKAQAPQNKSDEPVKDVTQGNLKNVDGMYMLYGIEVPPEKAKPFQRYARHDAKWYDRSNGKEVTGNLSNELENNYQSIFNSNDSTSDEKPSNDEAKSDTQSNEPQGSTEVNDQVPANTQQNTNASSETDDSTNTENEASSGNSSIPNGYVYTSGKGNKFIFKNGTWFNLATKKPVNQSNVNMLNRSAEKTITDYNSKNDIKIGSKVTSNKGTEYTFNGTGFISGEGKTLSGGAAQSAMNKLKAQQESSSSSANNKEQQSDNVNSSEVKPDDSGIVPGESALDTQTNTQGGSNVPPSEGESSNSSEQSDDYNAQSIINNLNSEEQGTQGGDSTDSTDNAPKPEDTPPASNNSNDPLTKLAQKIKGNKYNKQIVTLLSRGSDMDILAADILLNGNIQEVISQLQSLNNSNTQ